MSDKPEPTREDAEQEITEEHLEEVAGGVSCDDTWDSNFKASKPKGPSTNFGGDDWGRK